MSTSLQGSRIEYDGAGIPDAGTYWKLDGVWYGMTPNGMMANLSNHAVAEHEDRTISVSPSILTTSVGWSWHGYLERGVWREC